MSMEEKTFKYREFFLLSIAAIFNSFLLYQSILIFLKKPLADAPGTFPLILSTLMVVLNVLVFFESAKAMPKNVETFDSFASALKAAIKEEMPLNVAVSFLWTIVYVVLMNYIGFVISTFIFLVGLMLYLDRKQWKSALIVSVIIVAVIYVIFGLLFRVRL